MRRWQKIQLGDNTDDRAPSIITAIHHQTQFSLHHEFLLRKALTNNKKNYEKKYNLEWPVSRLHFEPDSFEIK